MTARHSRAHLPDLRPLDPLRSIKIKLGVLVVASVTAASGITWVGLSYYHLGPTRTLPLAILGSLVVTQLLARGMTSPLREMTAAAREMARGDYSRRVRATSRDEVGELARAFNRMAADLEQVDGLRRQLVANVSHELRTPVAALRAQLENLVDGVAEPDDDALRSALTQTERLGRLITSLLDLSRLEAGAAALDVTDVALEPFLRAAVDDVALAARDGDLHFEVVVAPAGLTVRGDVERLRQVVVNLLGNAAKHSPPGGVVRALARTEGSAVVIDVVDQGPGIAPEDRERVFERFHRGNRAAGASTGGTGLGLAIVRWAVQLHGGEVAVADSAAGCIMRLRLPSEGPPASVGPRSSG